MEEHPEDDQDEDEKHDHDENEQKEYYTNIIYNAAWLKLKQYLLSACVLSFCSAIMPLSSDQVTALKNPDTKIVFQDQNPKKGGSNAWGRYDKYKKCISIGEATAAGANWQDFSSDFEKGYMNFSIPEDVAMPASKKRPWHGILHGWNNKGKMLSDHAGLKTWSVTCIEAVWKFASYVAILPPERWNCRILEWNMRGPRKRGRPAYTWETALQKYSIWKGFDNWIVEAAGREHWMLLKRDFGHGLVSNCT